MVTDHKPKRKTAAEILATQDAATEDVFVPEWDTMVTVIGLTKRQQLDIRNKSIVNDEVDFEKSQAMLFLEGVVDPRFTEDQLPALFEKNAGAVDRVLKVVLRLSGMQPEDVRKREAEFSKGQ